MLPKTNISTVLITVNPASSAISGTAGVCASSTVALSDPVAGGIWSSTNTTIARIGSTGVITGVAAGTSTISYILSSGCGFSAKTATVYALPAAITGTATVCSGSTTTLSDASGGNWTSSNTAVATVGASSGIVSGVTPGTAVITYANSAGCIAKRTVTSELLWRRLCAY